MMNDTTFIYILELVNDLREHHIQLIKFNLKKYNLGVAQLNLDAMHTELQELAEILKREMTRENAKSTNSMDC